MDLFAWSEREGTYRKLHGFHPVVSSRRYRVGLGAGGVCDDGSTPNAGTGLCHDGTLPVTNNPAVVNAVGQTIQNVQATSSTPPPGSGLTVWNPIPITAANGPTQAAPAQNAPPPSSNNPSTSGTTAPSVSVTEVAVIGIGLVSLAIAAYNTFWK
jgi:hypothetical protein